MQVYVEKARQEMENLKVHVYMHYRRVWGQKLHDTKLKVEQKTEVENLA